MSENRLSVAVVGHANAGKTSLVRTLLRDTEFGEVADQAGLQDELRLLHAALCSGLPVDPYPYLKSGDRCRVVAGPLIGIEGFVVRRKGLCQLVLQVAILGQAAAVEIEADLVEPLDG